MSEKGKDEQEQDGRPVLTNRQGHPVYDNQNNRTVGERGPTVLENYQFLEKISHFDRERTPERVVHARGAGAHGYFEAYGRVGEDPSSKTDSLREAPRNGKDHTPFVSGHVVRQTIGRQNNYGQAGARYRSLEDWERDELISNLVNLVGQCERAIQKRMVSHLSQCDEEYGRRVAEGLGIQTPSAETAGAHGV